MAAPLLRQVRSQLSQPCYVPREHISHFRHQANTLLEMHVQIGHLSIWANQHTHNIITTIFLKSNIITTMNMDIAYSRVAGG